MKNVKQTVSHKNTLILVSFVHLSAFPSLEQNACYLQLEVILGHIFSVSSVHGELTPLQTTARWNGLVEEN